LVNVHSDNSSPPRWLSKTSIVVGLALVVLLVVSAFVIHAPSVRPDELGFLLNGQVFTVNNETPLAEGFRSFYPAGFGFFTAVAAILGGTIAAQFRIMAAEGVAGVPDVNVTHVSDTAQTARDIGAAVPAAAAGADRCPPAARRAGDRQGS
jgi:hypothetical protein